MVAGGKSTSLCDMISFFIYIFCGSTFGTITYDAKRFKFIAVRFYDIAVIYMNHRFRRNQGFDHLKVRKIRVMYQLWKK